MKDLAIVIRCHGSVPINFHYGCTVNDVLTNSVAFDYSGLVKSLYIVTLAHMAGVCYGSPDIKKYMQGINRLENKLYEEENVKNTEELVNYLYGPKPKIQPVQDLNKEIFGISYDPEINMMNGRTLNKIYSGDPTMTDLGLYYLRSNGLTGNEINYVKNILGVMSNHINSGPNHTIKKSDILQELRTLGLDRLYLIDLSCYAFVNENLSSPPLNDVAVNWLNDVMKGNNLKGGKKRIRKTRQKIKRRSKKSIKYSYKLYNK
jgi:hypothetical protein